ncbi:MAG TPA: hypothetical protein PKV75_00970 [Desulfobacterales bacterium]|nr:hypothetical protein [Desulfobacterales bacterium]
MTEKKTGRGFFEKLFGGKGCCCSVQIEEIEEVRDKTKVESAIETGNTKKSDIANTSEV